MLRSLRFMFLAVLFLFSANYVQAQWEQQDPGLPDELTAYLWSVVDANTVWVSSIVHMQTGMHEEFYYIDYFLYKPDFGGQEIYENRVIEIMSAR